MIDRVSILAPSRASPLPQGFMVMQMLCMTLKPVGAGSVTFLRRFHVVIEAPRDIHGSIASPSCH